MSETKKPSIAKNGIIYLVFSILNAAFPFFTSMYVTRVLTSNGIGDVSYALNIVTYFAIFAYIGIPTYGMREISKHKDDKEKTNKIFTELMIINTVATTISLAAYIILVFANPQFSNEKSLFLYLFLGIMIFLNYFNNGWLYEGFENFGLGAITNLLSKIVTFVFLVLFVKSDDNLLIYGILSMVGLSGYMLPLFFFYRKYVRFDFKDLHFKQHFKPILFLVVVNLAIEIYSLVDVTMIGAILKDSKSPVTYYKYAHQIQKMLLLVANAITIVIVPRMVKFFKDNDIKSYNVVLTRAYTLILIVSLPMIIGVIFVSDQMLVWIYGAEYIACSDILKVLSLNIVISPLGYLLGSRVCLIVNKEKFMPIAVGVGTLVNIGLNAWFITIWGAIGAAVASVLSELVVLVVYLIFSHKYFKLIFSLKNHLRILISLVVMTGYLLLIYFFVPHAILKTILEIVGAVIIYFGLLVILKEDNTRDVFNKLILKLKHKN